MDVMLQRILELIGDKHGATKQLAEAIEVSPNTISNWKSGTNKSYTKKADKIADYYGVSVDWLCGRSDDREIKKHPPKVSAISRKSCVKLLKIITDYSIDILRLRLNSANSASLSMSGMAAISALHILRLIIMQRSISSVTKSPRSSP